MVLAYLALLGRILLTGYEKIIFKQAGSNAGSVETVFLIFSTGTLCLAPFMLLAEAPADWSFLWLAAASSLVYTVQTVFYIRALAVGEASLVGPLYYLNLFFLLVLTTIFLGESLTLTKLGGVLLLIYGTSFLNRRENLLHSLRALTREPAWKLMLVSSLLVAVGRTIDGFVVREVHPLVYTFALCLGTCCYLSLFLLLRGQLPAAARLLRTRWRVGLTAGAVDCYSYLLLMFAITRIEVSIAEPASMLGMVVTVILAALVFHERIRERLLGVAVMLLGTWLLFL